MVFGNRLGPNPDVGKICVLLRKIRKARPSLGMFD